MNNQNPCFYESVPTGCKQSWKVQYFEARGGYSETVWATNHEVYDAVEEAVECAAKMKAENESRYNAAIIAMDNDPEIDIEYTRERTERFRKITIERVFTLA